MGEKYWTQKKEKNELVSHKTKQMIAMIKVLYKWDLMEVVWRCERWICLCEFFHKAFPFELPAPWNLPVVWWQLKRLQLWTSLPTAFPLLHSLKPFIHFRGKRNLRISSAVPVPHTNREKKILFVMIFGEREKFCDSVVIISCIPHVRIWKRTACVDIFLWCYWP